MPPPTLKRPPVTLTPPTAQKTAAKPAKSFTLAPWTDHNEGEKICLYGKTGMGKTTLAAQIPGAVFIGIDDGGRKITNPLTNQPVNSIGGITSFQDMRDALHQRDLIPAKGTIVVDTVTKAEALAEQYIYANYKLKGGVTPTSMRAYGWDGAAHSLDVIRLLLTDLDPHVREGKNVILLAQQSQIRIPNAEGLDYLEDGPKLAHNNQYSNRTEVCEWCDHVLRIGYLSFEVRGETDAKAGKVNTGDMKRAIFCGGAAHFVAKSRPIAGNHLPPVVSFDSQQDNTLWQAIFEGLTFTQE